MRLGANGNIFHVLWCKTLKGIRRWNKNGGHRTNSTKKSTKEIMHFSICLDFSRLKFILRKLFAQIGSNFNNKDIDTIVLFFPGSLIIFGVTLSLAPGICRQIFGRYAHGKTVTVRITYLNKIEKKKCWYHGPRSWYIGCFVL